jgi:hypothetical protein
MNREQLKVLMQANGILQAFVEGRLQMWNPPQEYEGETVPGRWVTVEELNLELPAASQLRIKHKIRRIATEQDARERRRCLAAPFGSSKLEPGIVTFVDEDNPNSDAPYHVRLDRGSFDWFFSCFIEEEMSDFDPPPAPCDAECECEMQDLLA